MISCALQETCAKYTNGTKRKPHHMRLTIICTKFSNGKCSEEHDIKQGPACLISKGGKK